jgi:uncharacterized phiE125 gp8 family phage protein
MRQSLVNKTALNGEAVLSLADAKAHLRVLDSDSDTLIAALRDAAFDVIEQYAEKALASREFKWRGRLSQVMQMGIGPVTAISAISYLDENNTTQNLVAANTLRIALGDQVEFKTNVDVPTMAEGDGVAEITFTAGYTTEQPLPKSLLSAARLMLGHLFMNREAVTTGMGVVEMPFGVRQLCAPYRTMRL